MNELMYDSVTWSDGSMTLTKEFADYIVDQIFGWFCQRICFLQPKVVCLDTILLNEKNILVDLIKSRFI